MESHWHFRAILKEEAAMCAEAWDQGDGFKVNALPRQEAPRPLSTWKGLSFPQQASAQLGLRAPGQHDTAL